MRVKRFGHAPGQFAPVAGVYSYNYSTSSDCQDSVPGNLATQYGPPMTTRRCYSCDQAEGVYEAHLDHDATPVVLLCDACAIWEREAGSVVWIRTRP